MTFNETNGSPDSGPSSRLPPRQAAWLALAIALLVAVADWFTPANILLPIIYAVPLILTAWVGDRRFLWGLTGLLAALGFFQFSWGEPPLLPVNHQVMVINSVLSTVKILTVAFVVHFLIGARRINAAHRLRLERQRDELEQVNQELTRREEEIVRQNAALQSQAEELERQSEELRTTNEELAGREKMLEQLLDLSRSLSPELSRDETLRHICDALSLLAGNLPIAVMEKRDDELAVICHHGFGPDGPVSHRLPFAESFAAQVLARGQTGYVEDLDQRRELKVPQPRQGEPFGAVLGAPLRVRGRGLGVIEIYSPHKRAWSEADVVLVESLAVQTGVSLSAAELIEGIELERRRFESAFRTVPFGLAVAEDPQGSQVHVNPAGAALLGVPIGENLAAHTPAGARLNRYVLKHEKRVPPEQLPLPRALQGEEVQAEELTMIFPDGRRVTLLTSAAPLYDARSQVSGAVAAFVNITEQKDLQRELELRRREAEETSVRKTRFLAAVSHDIRTPVNAINLMAEVIRRYATDPAVAPQVPELTQKLQANARSLVDLVSDVLDLARFDSGKIELIESEFELGELLADECRHIGPLAQDKGLELILEPLERPIWLRTDRVKLARVIGNLLGNAIKFTERGSVRLSAALAPAPDQRVLLHVTDTGVGIPPEHIGLIFDEFAQVHNPARDRSKGTGLGLAICKRLADVMGGCISVTSMPGQGSTFTLALSAAQVLLRPESVPQSLPRPAHSTAQGTALNGLHLLLVEDHVTTREGTARLLTGEGAIVVEAADGRSALDQLRKGGVDLVLLDMMLPDLDGREVLRAIRADPPQGLRGVLVLTGDLTPERLAEVRQLGADALIGKPINVAELAAILESYRRGHTS